MLNKKEQSILNFIINEIEIEERYVQKYVTKFTVPAKVQDELWENFPETLLKLAPYMTLTEEVTIKMIRSKNPLFLRVVLKKSLTEDEQLCLVECCPEKLKEHQDNLDKEYDCLFPSTERAYRLAQETNPDLPDIDYIWID